jgi:ubiquinone/menaquinone biosynthesis C-methylase UbiE
MQPAAVAVSEDTALQPAVSRPATEEYKDQDLWAEGPRRAGLVGDIEDAHFKLDESVAFWKGFQRNGSPSAFENMREASSIMTSIAAEGAEGQQYALAHGVLRMPYFATNAVLGTLAFGVNTLISGGQSAQELGGIAGSTLAKGLDTEMVKEQGLVPSVATLLSRLLLESALSFQQDFRAVSSGQYRAPWDMSTPGHRQMTPQYAVEQTRNFIDEAVGTFGRRASEKTPGIWLESPLYPDYTKNDFHYQTDGWMSKRSADVYETSTEVVFLGRQDAMQRLSLLPLKDVAGTNKGKPRILEVACGTGRFATFIRDNHPTADVTLVDLSPFYLEAARENDEYWREMRFPNKALRPPPAKFVQAAAEALPFADGSFDAVVCVYLFHEMPEGPRRMAAAEMARVVAPGGTVILTDSMQRGDRVLLTSEIAEAFGKLNEPHVEDYIDTYLPSLFTSNGLTCDRKWVESVTKCLSFRKPDSEGLSEGAVA